MTNNIKTSTEILNNANHHLIILFSPYDCAYCQRERDFWRLIQHSNTRIDILGIANEGSKEELLNWKENAKINFSVYLDSDSLLMESLRILNTPIKLLVH